MRRAMFVVLCLLLTGLASAAFFPLGEFTIENPRVLIWYTKEVTLLSMNIVSLDGPEEYTLVQQSPAPGSTPTYATEYVLVTEQNGEVEPLAPGTYRITVTARDREGVTSPDTAEFVIKAFDVRLIEPAFGVADQFPFTVVLATIDENDNPSEARCSYSKTGFSSGMTSISSGPQSEHVIPNVDYRGTLYVSCEEEAGRKTERSFSIDWDATPPTITADANPSLVRDPRDKSTFITIETNENTVCTLDGEPFASGDITDRLTYTTYHEAPHSYADVNDNQEYNFSHELSCTDWAGHTNTTTLNVTVNFALFADITIHSPDPAISTRDFDLIVEPLFFADSCTVDGTAMNQNGDLFSTSYTGMPDGTHEFTIRCEGADDITRKYNVTIDTTPPSIIINASSLICSGVITASWSSDTPVQEYTYSVRDDLGVFDAGTTTQEELDVTLTRSVEGDLIWNVVAEDAAGNTGTALATLPLLREGEEEECGLPPFIRLVQPPLGFALSSPYTVTLATNRQAECRYALQSGVDWFSRATFSSSDGLQHSKSFSFQKQDLYVMCQEPNLKNHTKSFTIGVDTTPPVIAVSAEPNPVIDPAHKVVLMTVDTDDPTHCTYNGFTIDGNVTDESTYTDRHVVTLDFRDITSTSPITKQYQIWCKNLAGLTQTKQYAVQIDLAAGVIIERVSPDEITSEPFIVLAIQPNVDAACLWNVVNSSSSLQPFDDVTDNVHSVALGALEDGSHHYLVDCTGAIDRGTAAIDFTVDRVPPEIIDLTGPSSICEGRSALYYYNITGLSKEPVIAYSLDGPAGVEFQDNTTNAFVTVSAANLLAGRYELALTPIGRTGLAGSTQTMDIEILDNESETCTASQPDCGNGVAEGAELCDGLDVRGLSCGDIGLANGTLLCDASCQGFILASCVDTSVCGDGVATGLELCDGSDLRNLSCPVLGYAGGTLGCSDECTPNASACTGPGPNVSTCGDGVISGGESCDGTNMSDLSCAGLGFASGDLACSSCVLNSSLCVPGNATCGNDLAEPGEFCDGTDLRRMTCSGLGFRTGDLECSSCRMNVSDCVPFDPSTCDNLEEDPGEEGIDCGGTCPDCVACVNDGECDRTETCVDDVCVPLPPSHCTNGVKDAGELGIDCGSGCPSCKFCVDELDCAFDETCKSGTCVHDTSHCTNGRRDTTEENVDCGGTCPNACIPCTVADDCPRATMTCKLGVCVEPPIIDGSQPPDDDQNASVDDPPIGSEPNICTSNFECDIGESCVDGRCVPEDRGPPRDFPRDDDFPPPEDKGLDWFALTFIILGLLVMGGSGYYLYDQHGRKGFSPSTGPPTTPTRPAQPQQQVRQPEARAQATARQRMMQETQRQRVDRASRRHAAFDAFGSQPATKKPVQKKTPAEPKKPAKPTQKKSAKKPAKKEDDVFDKLEKI